MIRLTVNKNFFSKIRLNHVLGIPNRHVCAKNRRNLKWNLEKMPKTVLSSIFPAFLTGKICFSNRLCHILDIAILHVFKSSKKILSTPWEIHEIPFFLLKSAVPAIFRKFGLQVSVLFTIEPCPMEGIVMNHVFVWKNNKI